MCARKKIRLFDLGSRNPIIAGHSRRETREKPTIELIGEGPYSFYMLDQLLGEGFNVINYAVRGEPFGRIDPSADVKVRRFAKPKGLARVVGNADFSVVFSLGMRIPEEVTDKFDGNLLNLHPSRLPEFEGVADPIKAMA